MNIIKKIFMFIFDQLHKGNPIPAGLLVAAIYYIVIPLYDIGTNRIGANTQANAEIAIDMYELSKKVAKLEKTQKQQFKDREPGVMGYTSK